MLRPARNRAPGCAGEGMPGCAGGGMPGCARTGNGGPGGRVPWSIRGEAAKSRGIGVSGSVRETITGERRLHLLGHLITSRQKRSTYPSILSNQQPICIMVSNLVSNNWRTAGCPVVVWTMAPERAKRVGQAGGPSGWTSPSSTRG